MDQIIRTTVGGTIEVEMKLPEAGMTVEADASQFETAVLNARDAMPEGGRVTIAVGEVDAVPAVRGHAAAPGEFVSVSIADQGIGMDLGTLSKIFEPFFTTKPVDKGTGLGLSQVYGFAKQSGGEINAEGALGSGTTFTLYLPRSTSQAAPSRPQGGEAGLPAVPKRKILLVEDNEAVGAFAADLLRELGQAVRWIGDGQSALDILRKDGAGYDLVFSDVVMPGISGIELARTIATEWPDLEVILTSGYSHVLAEEGSFGFQLLKKPYSIDGLLKALRQDGST